MTPEQAAGYIAGFIDGEGHIGRHRTAAGNDQNSITFVNTDRVLIEKMRGMLALLGITTRIYASKSTRKNWNDKWVVRISGGRPMFEKFAALIPLQAPKKQATLAAIVKSYKAFDALKAERRTAQSKPCEVCEKPVYAHPGGRKAGRGRFCSHACRGAAQEKWLEKSCTGCGATFRVKPGRGIQQFCSIICYHAQPTTRAMLVKQSKLGAAIRWSHSKQLPA